MGQHLPLYVMVHGCNSNDAEQERANLLDPLADREHFVVLYVDHDTPRNTSVGTHPVRCWRFYTEADKHRGQGDPAIIARQTTLVAHRWNIDPTRIYLAGMSSGGMMASDLAGAYPDLYAAVAVVAGCAYGAGTLCFKGLAKDTDSEARAANAEQGPRARVVPVLAIQGDSDGTVSSANNALVTQQWLKANNLALSGRLDGPLPLTPTTSVTRHPKRRDRYLDETYRNRGGQVVVERVLISGMDHYWPGGSAEHESAKFTDPRGPSGAELTWRFFSRYRMTPQRNAAR